MRRDELGVLAAQCDAGLGNIHPDDRVAVRSVADEFSCVVVKAAASWMNKDVTTREDLRAEIDALIIDNRCDGITPTKLHKVLRDMERIGDR